MSAFGKTIPKEAVCIFPPDTSKREALEMMMKSVESTGAVKDHEALRRALFERESIRSTGFKGIAIPHVRIDEISEPTVAVGISQTGIDFESLDSEPVNIIVLFAMPSGSDKEYLGFLAQVMMALRTGGFTEQLVQCKSPQEVLEVLEKGP